MLDTRLFTRRQSLAVTLPHPFSYVDGGLPGQGSDWAKLGFRLRPSPAPVLASYGGSAADQTGFQSKGKFAS
jgi:hypothetical protein